MLPAASAAAALAQLHNHKLERDDWESEGVGDICSQKYTNTRLLTPIQDWMSDTEAHKQAMRSSIELPPLHHGNNIEPTSEPFSHLNPHRRRELLPSILSTSPPGRSSTLPPLHRPGPARPRKQSVSKRAREPQHKRQKSKGENTHLRRMSYDRKAYSAEPSSGLSAAYGKRWEDLIDAATSATSDVDEDRTPVSLYKHVTISLTEDSGPTVANISTSSFTPSLLRKPLSRIPSLTPSTGTHSTILPPRSP
jgi:hypothetical protein